MRSTQATISAHSIKLGKYKYKYIAQFAGIPLSPSDVIAFCELEDEESFHLLQLRRKRDVIKWLMWEENNYNEELEEKKDAFSQKKMVQLQQQFNPINQQIDYINTQHQILDATKRLFAYQLADSYQTGKYNTSMFDPLSFMGKDINKATQYLTKATNTKYQQKGFHNTATFYKYIGFFTAARLFVLRENNVLKYFDKDFLPIFSRTLFPFACLGFSYALELIFDLGILIKAFIEGRSVRDTFFKDDRPARMANAAVWAACNILCFAISGGLINAVVNLAAFTFDIGNECYRAHKELKKYRDFLDKVTSKINRLENKLSKMDDVSSVTEKNELYQLRCVKTQLETKIKAIKRKRYWSVACTVAILLGMILVFFPPAFIPYAGLMGTIIAFTAGSVFLGFGKRIFEWGCQLEDQKAPDILHESKPFPNKLQLLKNVILKVTPKRTASLSMQLALLTQTEIKDLRHTLDLKTNVAWQEQLKAWGSSYPRTAKNCNTFFHKNHSTFLQTLEKHLANEELIPSRVAKGAPSY